MLNNERIIDQLESQASHIMRMYEEKELEDKMIDLALEWFYKGVKWGLNHNKEKSSEDEK